MVHSRCQSDGGGCLQLLVSHSLPRNHLSQLLGALSPGVHLLQPLFFQFVVRSIAQRKKWNKSVGTKSQSAAANKLLPRTQISDTVDAKERLAGYHLRRADSEMIERGARFVARVRAVCYFRPQRRIWILITSSISINDSKQAVTNTQHRVWFLPCRRFVCFSAFIRARARSKIVFVGDFHSSNSQTSAEARPAPHIFV